MAELQARGVNIMTPRCNVSSEHSLSAILSSCAATMPPIKGCINAALVLSDSLFENMTVAQWDVAVKAKV
jgi:hypothetical protein